MKNFLVVVLVLVTGTAFGQCYYQVPFPFWTTTRACAPAVESMPITSACAAPRAVKVPEKAVEEEPEITAPLPHPSVVPPMLRCPTGRCPLMFMPKRVEKRVEACAMSEPHNDILVAAN